MIVLLQGDLFDLFDLFGPAAAASPPSFTADAVVVDAPYSEATTKGHNAGASDANDGHTRGLIGYPPWAASHVESFCRVIPPLVPNGWIVSVTDDILGPHWRYELQQAGRYAFHGVPAIIPGGRFRMQGDGPPCVSYLVYAARPRTRAFIGGWTPAGYYIAEGPPKAGPLGSRLRGEKSVDLMTQILRDYVPPAGGHTPKRRLVLDPCCGRGSTLVAAHQLHHDALGVEVDPGTFELLTQRLGAEGAPFRVVSDLAGVPDALEQMRPWPATRNPGAQGATVTHETPYGRSHAAPPGHPGLPPTAPREPDAGHPRGPGPRPPGCQPHPVPTPGRRPGPVHAGHSSPNGLRPSAQADNQPLGAAHRPRTPVRGGGATMDHAELGALEQALGEAPHVGLREDLTRDIWTRLLLRDANQPLNDLRLVLAAEDHAPEDGYRWHAVLDAAKRMPRLYVNFEALREAATPQTCWALLATWLIDALQFPLLTTAACHLGPASAWGKSSTLVLPRALLLERVDAHPQRTAFSLQVPLKVIAFRTA